MLTSFLKSEHKYFVVVIMTTFLIALSLGIATYYINYWPTDSHLPYIPAAKRVFESPFISHIHEVTGFKLIMRGKETLILGIALMQRLLNDFESLYPNVLLLIIATAFSGILFYLIFKKIFDAQIGFLAFVLFASSFWPYLYILQGAHPPLVLMNFLLAILLLWHGSSKKIFFALSGCFLGFMLFSSPTSALYVPYYVGFFVYQHGFLSKREKVSTIVLNGGLIVLGSVIVFLYFSLPNPSEYIQNFIKFLEYSRKGNDFTIWRKKLMPFFEVSGVFRGAGWSWIFKYFFFIMPVMFTVYIVCLGHLMIRSIRKPLVCLIVLLSFSTPLAVEIIRVAQFGRNYFSWIVGIILVISTSAFYLKSKISSFSVVKIRLISSGLLIITAAHLIFNGYVFFADVFPSRMATTKIYRWLIQNDIKSVYAYRDHPRNKNIIEFLKNPKAKQPIRFVAIKSLSQLPQQGYLLLPPITGKTIYNSCVDHDYEIDPLLSQLFASGSFEKAVVASFPTLSSSRFWVQEEEVCTYRDLILGQITDEDRQKGRAWVVDVKKIRDN